MTGRNPYLIPDTGDHRVINFSGGETSGYMLYQILQAHGGRVPDNATALFCNTGKELEETLAFVDRVSKEWGVKIHWLEFDFNTSAKGGLKDPKYVHRVVDFDTASRKGEPFDRMLTHRHLLPNPTRRSCTSELKVRTVERFMRRDMRITRYRNIIGIRYDEPRRWIKASMENCMLDHPLQEARVTKAHVKEFWAAQNFGLGLESFEGNCDGCFLKGRKKLMAMERKRPGTSEWWAQKERECKAKYYQPDSVDGWRFRLEYSYDDLIHVVNTQPEFEFDGEGLADDEGLDCFCGD